MRDLAQRSGVSSSSVSDTELGRRPRADTVERLAVALRVDPCWLAYGDTSKAPEWLSDGEKAAEH